MCNLYRMLLGRRQVDRRWAATLLSQLAVVVALILCSSYVSASVDRSHVSGAIVAVSDEKKEGASSASSSSPHPADDVCPAFSFASLVAAATGQPSSISALTTCGTTPYSSLLADVEQSRQYYDTGATITTALSKVLHNTRDEPLYFDNAPIFLSLRAEMGAWMRANRTVGMNPAAYEAVVRGVGAVLGLDTSLFDLSIHDIASRAAAAAATLPLTGSGKVNWTQQVERCGHDSACVLQAAQQAYLWRTAATLAAHPELLVSNVTFQRARHYYRHAVFPSIIVRAFELDPETTQHSFDRNIGDLLRSVQQLWDSVAGEVEAEGAAAAAPPRPYLPFLRETDLTGPRRRGTRRLSAADANYSHPSRHQGMRLQALRRVLPTVVVYQTSTRCTSCALYDRAFDVLPAVYKRLCVDGYRSIISCSPLTLFLRTTHLRSFQPLPSLSLYARLVYSRAAVLRVGNTQLLRSELSGGQHEGKEEEEDDDDDRDGDESSSTSALAGEQATTATQRRSMWRHRTMGSREEEEEEEGDEDTSVDEDEITSGSRFYSLSAKYGRWSTGIEDEVRPRSQFRPHHVFLRPHAEAASVEEAVVSIITSLVESGVVQFQFLEPDEVKRISRDNARLRRQFEAEEAERRRKRREAEAAEKAEAAEQAEATGNTSASARTVSENVSSSSSSSPPPVNPEDHPQYRKMVSFHDLATQMVATHTRAIFGTVQVDGSRGDASGTRRSRDGAGGFEPSMAEASLSWSSVWFVRAPRAAWDLLFSGIERPLYLMLFVLLCLYQRWWNRWQRVSYW